MVNSGGLGSTARTIQLEVTPKQSQAFPFCASQGLVTVDNFPGCTKRVAEPTEVGENKII